MSGGGCMKRNIMRFVSLSMVAVLSFGVLMTTGQKDVSADTADSVIQEVQEIQEAQDEVTSMDEVNYDVSDTLKQVESVLDQTEGVTDSIDAPIITIDPTAQPKKTTTKKSKPTGKDVVKYAKKFVGNKYKWGGTSLTKGADCSGFTQSVYKHFGYKLPRTSSAQRKAGKGVKVSQRKAGDLICYSGHVAIYMGSNKIVHASNSKPYPKGGIKISRYNYRKIKAVRRIIK